MDIDVDQIKDKVAILRSQNILAPSVELDLAIAQVEQLRRIADLLAPLEGIGLLADIDRRGARTGYTDEF